MPSFRHSSRSWILAFVDLTICRWCTSIGIIAIPRPVHALHLLATRVFVVVVAAPAIILLVKGNVLRLHVYNTLPQQPKRLPDVIGPDKVIAMQPGQRLRKTNHGLQLPNGNPIGRAAPPHGIPLPQPPVAIHEYFSTLVGNHGIERPCEADVAPHLVLREGRFDDGLVAAVDVDNVLGDIVVRDLDALVEYHEEEIESAENGRRQLDVGPQGLGSIISSVYGIGRGEYRSPCIKRGLNPRLGNRNGLLFHRLMNCHLIVLVHLIKLIDATNPIVGQHERSGLDAELSRVLIAHDGGGESGGGGGLAGGVDAAVGEEAVDVLEELGLGGGGVADDADVDVAAEADAFGGGFVYAAEEHEEDAAFDF